MTTKAEIRGWLERGKEKGASHMLVVCDTFDWDDYPVFVTGADEARKKFDAPGAMQKVMEVYKIDHDWDAQLNAGRAFVF